jgi:hypothetical protein
MTHDLGKSVPGLANLYTHPVPAPLSEGGKRSCFDYANLMLL